MLDVKKLLGRIVDAFKTTSTTLTGSYNLKATAYKRCGIVTLSIHQSPVASLPKGTWTSIGTLPQEFRPLQQIDALAVENNTSSVQNNSMQVRISTSGNVGVYAYSNGATNNEALVAITFVGGVLLNSIFKAFSHLQKIGGGVNAGRKETVDEDAEKSSKVLQHNVFRLSQDWSKWLHEPGNSPAKQYHSLFDGEFVGKFIKCVQSCNGIGECHLFDRRTEHNRKRFGYKGYVHIAAISERGWVLC